MWRCGCDHGKEVSGWRGEACIARMCRGSLEFVDFYMPFSGKLNPDNRWVKLARLVPWELAEKIYADAFCEALIPRELAVLPRCRLVWHSVFG